MKARIMMSMLVIALAAAMIGGATMAVFTAEDQTEPQTYAAGTVEIGVDEVVTIDVGEELLENMAPGDSVAGSFTVENVGCLDLWFEVTAKTEKVDGANYLFSGENGAQVVIDEDCVRRVLENGDTCKVNFTVELPLEAGNWYQGAQGKLYFEVHAEQLRNNEPTWYES